MADERAEIFEALQDCDLKMGAYTLDSRFSDGVYTKSVTEALQRFTVLPSPETAIMLVGVMPETMSVLLSASSLGTANIPEEMRGPNYDEFQQWMASCEKNISSCESIYYFLLNGVKNNSISVGFHRTRDQKIIFNRLEYIGIKRGIFRNNSHQFLRDKIIQDISAYRSVADLICIHFVFEGSECFYNALGAELGVDFYLNSEFLIRINSNTSEFFKLLTILKPSKKESGEGNKDLYESGYDYYTGDGVEQDIEEAVRLFKLAVENGDAHAQSILGYMYSIGEGVEKDLMEAIRLYGLAAEQGDAGAQNNLGLMCEHGQGIMKDIEEAVRLYKLAVEQGESVAQYNLARMIYEGEGVEQDIEEAVRLFTLAAEQGSADAQTRLAHMYEKGIGVEQDIVEAVRFYKLASNQGNAYAQSSLGYLYEKGIGVEQDMMEAVRLYTLASEQGDAYAQGSLGYMYSKGEVVEKNLAEAIRLCTLAAEQGSVKAQKNLDILKRI